VNIYVQKLSDPFSEWSLDVEPSDTIEGAIGKLVIAELPAVYDSLKVTLFFNSTTLDPLVTLTDYGIGKDSHLTSLYTNGCNEGPPWDKWEVPGECGFHRFMRLRLLGYI